MNRSVALFQTPLARVVRFDHPEGGGDQCDAETEVRDWYGVSFVEGGSFCLARAAERWTFGLDDVELSYPGDSLEYTHPTGAALDVCLAVHVTPEMLLETLGAPARDGRPLKVPASGRTIFERDRLARALATGESLGIEFALQRLVPAFFGGGHRSPEALHRSGRFPFYLKQVRDAVELLTHECAQQHTLSELARRVAISPYHFTRLFAALVGCPPHQYLMEVRLHHAARRLLDGDTVTSAAFASGFQNLSHFIRTFRKRFGVSPSQYAKRRAGGVAPETGPVPECGGTPLSP